MVQSLGRPMRRKVRPVKPVPALRRAQAKTFLARFIIFFAPSVVVAITALRSGSGPLCVLTGMIALCGAVGLLFVSLPDIVRTVIPGFSGSIRAAEEWVYSQDATAISVRWAGNLGLYAGILLGAIIVVYRA